MRFKKLILILCGSLLVAAVLGVFLTPFLVASGLRLWIARTARQEGLRIEFEKIEAPLWRPVIVHKLQITSPAETTFRVKVEASRIELNLDFAAIFNRSRGRFLRSLSGETIVVDIRRNPQSPPPIQGFAWRILEDFLADNFKLSGVELHVENEDTVVDLHNGTLSGTQIEAGVFSASDITIASPLFRKSFSHLRGATSWQESRLTIGALSLTRGLDIDVVSIDLSHIGESRLALEMALDAFGGKLRASVSSEDHGNTRTWDAAGSASGISLAQMSDALELTDRARGSVRACKFTFRGEATNFRDAAATIWAEVTGLTWRDRTADTIMIGASLYNRQVHVEQLFVKQRNNQFNLSGESALPQTWSDWLNPDFHGEIVASINDLGDFARLFGASAADFAGKIDIAGSVNARERKLAGHLSVSGNSLTLLRAPFESLSVELNLKESQLEIEQFDLRRENDSFRGEASIDLAGERAYSFTFTNSIADIADYADLLPAPLQSLKLSGNLELNWTGKGTEATHSGTFHAQGHGLHPQESPFLPFDAEFEGDYSPENIFFRQFNLSNEHAAFTAFVTIAKDYFQLQTLRLDLNGQPRLQGNIFLPVSLAKLRAQDNWLAALSDYPNFDLDLILDQMDLAELAGVVTMKSKMSGQVSGSVEFRGKPATLEGKSSIHIHDFVFGNEPALSGELETRASLGTVSAKATALARGSDPINLEASFPLKLEKREPGYALNTEGPLSATLNFPTVLLSKLPLYVSRWMFVDGILSGRLNVSDSLSHPQLRGTAQLINARPLGRPMLSTSVTFGGETATIDFAQIVQQNVRPAARGEIDFRNPADITLRIWPNAPVIASTLLNPDECIDGIKLFSSAPLDGSMHFVEGRFGARINEIDFHGSLFASNWTIALHEKRTDDPLETLLRGGPSQTFSICPNLQPSGKDLDLSLVDGSFLEGSADSKRRRQRK
jgi:hypothetical protein